MLQQFQDRMAARLIKINITRKEETTQFVILMVALLYCMGVHIVLLALFFAAGIVALGVINSLSVAIYACMLLLHIHQRDYKLEGLVISLEVGLYAFVSAYLVGIDTYQLGYYVLVLVLQFILPYARLWLRGVVCALTLVLMSFSILLHFTTQPPFALPQWLYNVLLVFNLLVLSLGIVVELMMNHVVNRILNTSDDMRMAELTSLANTDSLTGLYNRRYAEQYLEELLASQSDRPYCVAMLDIDDFKQVNDTLGHAAGDDVLVYLAQKLCEGLRRTDTVFRWGGEELLIILDHVEPSVARVILNKQRRELAEAAISTVAGPVHITVTIGVTQLDLQRPDESIQRCDDNLYWGKEHGKNCVVDDTHS